MPGKFFVEVKVNIKAIAEDIRVLTEGGVKLSNKSIEKIVEEHVEVVQ